MAGRTDTRQPRLPVEEAQRIRGRSEFITRTGNEGCRGRRAGDEPKMPQNFFDDLGLIDDGDDLHLAAAVLTQKNVYLEYAFHQL